MGILVRAQPFFQHTFDVKYVSYHTIHLEVSLLFVSGCYLIVLGLHRHSLLVDPLLVKVKQNLYLFEVPSVSPVVVWFVVRDFLISILHIFAVLFSLHLE